jgi:dihydroorotate dehydrogenase
MAKAGASLVQLYTSFGYRGVGTPRLIKDEITSSLHSSKSTWKSSIGSSWNDSQMGWKGEEEQFKKTSEQLRKEAEGLGELLKNLRNKEDTASLVRKAEEALGKFKSPTPQPRDNLLGSINEGNMPAIEQTTSQPTGASERTITSGNVGGVPAGLETVLPTEAADLAPIVVEEIPPPHQPEVDEWTQTVREGQRRLV